uniref:Uncharacterized protein n=1 Tax=Anguilla anguilla TaxID=7936 RepID=A0A0E9QQ47_ANGAN
MALFILKAWQEILKKIISNFSKVSRGKKTFHVSSIKLNKT